MLATLGFNKYWRKASNKNQAEQLALLFTFRNNLTGEIRAELTSAGVNADRVQASVDLATTFNNANITQETLKGTGRQATEQTIAAFNEIYATAMDICKVAQRLFRKDKTRKELFIFSKIVKQQGGGLQGHVENGEAEQV